MLALSVLYGQSKSFIWGSIGRTSSAGATLFLQTHSEEISCQSSYKTQNISAHFCYSLESVQEQKGWNVCPFSCWSSLFLHCCSLLLPVRAFGANYNRRALQIIRSAWILYHWEHLIWRSLSAPPSSHISPPWTRPSTPAGVWCSVKFFPDLGLLEHITCDSSLLGSSGNVPF